MEAKEVFIRPEKCTGCLSCRLACAAAHSKAGTFLGAVAAGEKPKTRIFVHRLEGKNLPMNCRHCTDSPCVDACIAASMHVAEGGLVTNHDRQVRCVGCWMCVMSCPFGAIRSTGGDEPRAVKCDRQCAAETGVPACVRACPTGALVYSSVDQFSAAGREDFFRQWLKAGAVR
ncbi:MAG: 4Fe-4S dicluster domain-containing protein [Peptococcaceae bacterium]|nr:4Fe-4S dicluster domain-containing protein [Peptococcaceae bacterium]